MNPEEEKINEEHVEDPQTEIEQLSDHLREYVGIRRELFELKLWDKLFGTSAAIITWSVIVFLGIICFFLLSAGLAWWVGTLIGKVYLGFLIVAGAFGLIATLLYIGRDHILQKPLTDRFIAHLVNDDEDEEHEQPDRKTPDHEQKAA